MATRESIQRARLRAAEAVRLHGEWKERIIPGDAREVESYRNGGLEALAAFMTVE